MSRKPPTQGTSQFFAKYLETYLAKFSSNHTEDNKAKMFEHLRNIQNTYYNSIRELGKLEVIQENSPSKVLDDDKSEHMKPENGWDKLILEDLVDSFGRYGEDSISSMAEGLLFTNALAIKFGANKIFYRGEQNYGWELISSAERKLDLTQSYPLGLTDRELEEIARFQKAVRSNASLAADIFGGSIPDDESTAWLPAMQHYDTLFGTRLLDLTRSVFAGLYFACVGWDGNIDEEHDGLLYSIFDRSSRWRGQYIETDGDVDENDDATPAKLSDSFKDWKHPEYFRLYQTSSMNPRELAQDGVFLVRGIIGGERSHGQGFKFRIPAECKERIIRELWFAGFTPARIVRGQAGIEAEEKLRDRLGMIW